MKTTVPIYQEPMVEEQICDKRRFALKNLKLNFKFLLLCNTKMLSRLWFAYFKKGYTLYPHSGNH